MTRAQVENLADRRRASASLVENLEVAGAIRSWCDLRGDRDHPLNPPLPREARDRFVARTEAAMRSRSNYVGRAVVEALEES